jgi:hypothetical protein
MFAPTRILRCLEIIFTKACLNFLIKYSLCDYVPRVSKCAAYDP